MLNFDTALELGVNVLVQGSAGCHIQYLKTSANTQNRFVHLDCLLHQWNLQRIALRSQCAAAVHQLFSEQTRVDVRSAAEDHAIHMVEDFFNVRCTDSAFQVVQLDWDTAARADTVDKIWKNIAVLLLFLIAGTCFGCDCNDWFSHRLNPPLYCLGIRLADRPLIHDSSAFILSYFFPFVNTQKGNFTDTDGAGRSAQADTK